MWLDADRDGDISGYNNAVNNLIAMSIDHDPDDISLSDITVQLFTDPDGDGDPADGIQVGDNAVTDGGGNYDFADIAP